MPSEFFLKANRIVINLRTKAFLNIVHSAIQLCPSYKSQEKETRNL
jgi:hypothetical protein